MRNKYRTHEFAKRIGRSIATTRRWKREGKFTAKRPSCARRYFDESDVRIALGGAADNKDAVVYCRVSIAAHKDDLASQAAAMQAYCLAGRISVDQWIQEAGGDMNFKRKGFLEIIDRIQRGKIDKLIAAHKERLMRFGFDLFSPIAAENGREIVLGNQESLSPQQEMVEDLMAIVHTFSRRLYGMRKYKSDLKADFPKYKLAVPKEALQ